MSLLAGYRFAIAPKFHLNAEWASRVAVGTGVVEIEGKFFPRDSWRPPTLDELALLVVAPEPVAASPRSLPLLDDSPGSPTPPRTSDDCISLFLLPAHLRDAWWKLVDAAAESGQPMQGFDGFAASVTEFLLFKQLAASSALQMDVLVTAPGERSIRVDPDTGRPSGLGSTVASWLAWPILSVGEGTALPRLHAVANLGDETAGVVFINLTLPGLAARLAQRASAELPLTTVGELVARFLRACPDYPPVRLQLEPGEACRLPPGGLILDADMTGKEEPGVLLLISEGG